MNKKLQAKKSMLKRLKQMMREDMYEPHKDEMKEKMQKITVMSDSSEGLEEGLSKAQKILEKRKDMDEEDEYSCGGIEKDDYMDGGYKKKKKMK